MEKWIENNNCDTQSLLKLCDLKYRNYMYLNENGLNKERNECEHALEILFSRECWFRIICRN